MEGICFLTSHVVWFNVLYAHREGLMTYKQFIGELEDDILPAEAERRYVWYLEGPQCVGVASSASGVFYLIVLLVLLGCPQVRRIQS